MGGVERIQSEVEESGDGTTSEEQRLHGMALILCCLSLLLCMFLVALDMTIVVTIFETVGAKFGDFGKISWITSGFMLPIAVLAMSWGKISVIVGRKYTMLAAIFIFEIGSLIAGLANSMNMLIGGRVIQGIGGGGIQVMVFVILTEVVSIEKRGLAQGLVGMSFGVASVLGPLIGGAFTDDVTWRWCFYINLPIGGIAAVCLWYLFNPPRPRGNVWEKIKKIDYIGSVLLSVGVVLVLLAPTLGSTEDPWDSAIVIAFFVVGGVVCIVFCIWNFMFAKYPLIPAGVGLNIWVLLPSLTLYFMFSSFMSSVMYITTFFQVVGQADALHSGLQLLPLIIPVVIFSILGGVAITVTQYTKPFAIIGTAIASIGLGLVTMMDRDISDAKRIGYLILPGVGMGLIMQSLVLNAQTAAPRRDGGVLLATALIAFFRGMGGVIGSVIGQTIQSVITATSVDGKLPAGADPTTLVNNPDLIWALPEAERDIVLDGFVDGFRDAMYWSLANILAAFVLSLFLTNRKINAHSKPKDKDPEKHDSDSVPSETSHDSATPAEQPATSQN